MISIGLPVYNQSGILYVALEGLCGQVDAGDWELIICSEDDISIKEYEERLRKCGCKKIFIDKLDSWIPLPQKWRRIGQQMDPESIGLILQAADCYPHKDRIAQSRKAMEQGYDWYHEQRGYFYHLGLKKMVVFDGSLYNRVVNLNMCIASVHVRDLPPSDKIKGIDGWLFRLIANPKVYVFKGLPNGVDFHGANTISFKRGTMIKECKKPFMKTDVKLKNVLSKNLLSMDFTVK